MKAIKIEPFGQINQESISRYILETDEGIRVVLMPYGATLLEYWVPDQFNQLSNIVLGFDQLEAYVHNAPKFGATVGPLAGRLAKGQFELNGQVYQLEQNDGANHLHGGSMGYDAQVFQLVSFSDGEVVFELDQADGQGGYPGNRKTRVTYRLDEQGRLEIDLEATSDQDTLMNPTNHAYFNLSGNPLTTLDTAFLKVNAQAYTPLLADNLPTGELNETDPLLKRLQKGTTLDAVFTSSNRQVRDRNGLDHAFVLDSAKADALHLVDELSGRSLVVQTDAPALVLYSANGYDEKTKILGQTPPAHNGLAIEPQVLPDALHHPGFGQTILLAHQTFRRHISYQVFVLYSQA